IRLKTQFDNLGDALINRELIRLLATHGQVHVDTTLAPSSFVDLVFDDLPSGVLAGSSPRCFWINVLWSALKARSRHTTAWLILNPGGNGGEISRKKYLQQCIRVLAF